MMKRGATWIKTLANPTDVTAFWHGPSSVRQSSDRGTARPATVKETPHRIVTATARNREYYPAE